MFTHQRFGLGFASLLFLACSNDGDGGPTNGTGGSGGRTNATTGGSSTMGGLSGTGSTKTLGGSSGVGGTAGNGGTSTSAGQPAAGGTSGGAGASNVGAASSVGGMSRGGGAPNVGGTSGVGGASGVGGTSGNAGSAGAAGGTTSVPTFTVSGRVTGLLGSGLTLKLNGGADLRPTADGVFSFSTELTNTATYAVTVSSQPTNPEQACLVVNGTGRIGGSDENSVIIKCPLRARYNLVVDSVDNSVSSYAIDGASGRSTYVGKATTGLSSPASVAVDPTGKYAYVANAGNGTIAQYKVGANGTLAALEPATVPAGTGPKFITIDAFGTYAYAVTNSNLSRFTVGASGVLTAQTEVAAVATTDSVALHPNGKYAYVALGSAKKISQYNLADNSLAASIDLGANPSSIAVDALGNFAYLITSGSNDVSQYPINATDGKLQSPVTVLAGTHPVSIALDPLGRCAYVVNSGDATNSASVSLHRIENGVLVAASATVATEAGPTSIVVDPVGRYAYVANATGNSISQFIISVDGSLAANAPPRVAAQQSPTTLALAAGVSYVDPYGKYLYLTNGDNSLSSYGISPTDGTLTALTQLTVAVAGPVDIGVDPTGSRAYLVNATTKSVSQYSIDSAGGLTAIATPVATGSVPSAVAVHPSNRAAYVVNQVDKSISQYAIGSDGALTAMVPPTIAAAVVGAPVAIIVDPSGRFAYVAITDGTVARFNIGAGGALDVATAAAFPAGAQPAALSINSGGTHLYAANSSDNSISQYSIGADLKGNGVLTALNPVTVPTGPVPLSIALDPSGNYAFVANAGGSSISQYKVNLTTTASTYGTLSVLAQAPVLAGSFSPYKIAVDPSGRYAYAVNSRSAGGAIWRYNVSTTSGTLETPVSVPSGTSSRSIAIAAGYR